MIPVCDSVSNVCCQNRGTTLHFLYKGLNGYFNLFIFSTQKSDTQHSIKKREGNDQAASQLFVSSQ